MEKTALACVGEEMGAPAVETTVGKQAWIVEPRQTIRSMEGEGCREGKKISLKKADKEWGEVWRIHDVISLIYNKVQEQSLVLTFWGYFQCTNSVIVEPGDEIMFSVS